MCITVAPMSAGMAEYRLYRFDKEGHIQGPPP